MPNTDDLIDLDAVIDRLINEQTQARENLEKVHSVLRSVKQLEGMTVLGTAESLIKLHDENLGRIEKLKETLKHVKRLASAARNEKIVEYIDKQLKEI